MGESQNLGYSFYWLYMSGLNRSMTTLKHIRTKSSRFAVRRSHSAIAPDKPPDMLILTRLTRPTPHGPPSDDRGGTPDPIGSQLSNIAGPLTSYTRDPLWFNNIVFALHVQPTCMIYWHRSPTVETSRGKRKGGPPTSGKYLGTTGVLSGNTRSLTFTCRRTVLLPIPARQWGVCHCYP